MKRAEILAGFSFSVIVGGVLIYGRIGLPYSPVIPLLLYVVFVASRVRQRPTMMTHETQDSPYFMGLIFTLMSLAVAFSSVEKNIDIELIFSSLGSALITTIVGLVMRILLHMWGSEEEAARSIFTNLVEDLRNTSGAFQVAQVSLSKLIEDFAHQRKILQKEEQKAAEQLIGRMKALSASVAGLLNENKKLYGGITTELESQKDRLNASLGSLSGGLEGMSNGLGNLPLVDRLQSVSDKSLEAATGLHQLAGQAQLAGGGLGALSDAGKTAAERVTGHFVAIEKVLGALASYDAAFFQALRDKIGEVAATLQAQVEATGRVHGTYLEKIRQLQELAPNFVETTHEHVGVFLDATTTFSQEASKLRQSVADSSPAAEVEKIVRQMGQAHQRLEVLVGGIEKTTHAFDGMHGLAGRTRQDLEHVDKILSDFIEVAESRIRKLK